MVKIYINGTEHEVSEGKNLLDTCLTLGYNVPYFCFHPAMGSVGACRLCAVKKFANDNDTKGRIVMSCMEPVAEGLRVSIDDNEVKVFRSAIIESLMTNHPHDCPVCDEGGECHLQDMTVMSGHNYRRFDFNKRTHKNQNLGPFIHHEMNRCIQCYRCVRFYKDYAGGKDLAAMASKNNVFFGRHEEGTLESEFSGNLVEVCPTGVFTDKTLRKNHTRKWDLTNAPSVCTHCSLGCNIIVSERYGQVRRVLNRYNHEVNGYFICDRGRFGYEFINQDIRVKQVLARSSKQSELTAVASNDIETLLKKAIFGNKIIGIGSAKASLEDNYTLQKLVGADNFYHGTSSADYELVNKAISILQTGNHSIPSLKEIEKADAIFVLGEDVTNTAPRAALALHQSVKNKRFQLADKARIDRWQDAAVRELGQDELSPLFIATNYATKLDDVATATYHASPTDIARLGYAVAALIDPTAPKVNDIPERLRILAEQIAKSLKEAKNPLIVTGTSIQDTAVLEAAANIAWALGNKANKAGLFVSLPESNSMGLGLLGGKSLNQALNTTTDTVIILENDLYRSAEKEKVDAFLNNCKQVIVIDQINTATVQKADLVLPSGTFAESDGTFINNEGRAQRYYKVIPITDVVKDAWLWIADLNQASGKEAITSLEVLTTTIAQNQVFSALADLPKKGDEKIAMQPLRYSGRTSMRANINLHEPKPAQDENSPMAFSMEGEKGSIPASITPFYWAPGWNSGQALSKYQSELNGAMKNESAAIMLLTSNGSANYFSAIPNAFNPSQEGLLIVPVYHIFGSGELSSLSAGITERNAVPTLFINSDEAQKLNLTDGADVALKNNKYMVQVNHSIPKGVVALSAGLPKTGFVEFGKIENIK
jgi:NADH-quinone oxidoreductase subunit G